MPTEKIEASCDECLVPSCCGCCDVRAGVIIITALGLLFNLINALFMDRQVLPIIALVLSVIFSVFGLIGAIRNHYGMTRAYAYFNWAYLIFLLIILIVGVVSISVSDCKSTNGESVTKETCDAIKQAATIFIVIIFLISFAIYGYLTAVVWSYCRYLYKVKTGQIQHAPPVQQQPVYNQQQVYPVVVAQPAYPGQPPVVYAYPSNYPAPPPGSAYPPPPGSAYPPPPGAYQQPPPAKQ